jgi:uncharacterized protein (TIGR01244 family)
MPLPPLRRLSPDYSAASASAQDDWPAVAAAGFRSVINHRPDHEDGPRQASAQHIGEQVREEGLAYAHQPVSDRHFGAGEVARLAALLATLPAPVLAFCRSGARSALLFEALVSAEGAVPPAEPEVEWLGRPLEGPGPTGR